MNVSIAEKKKKALEIMELLCIYRPYIKEFEKNNRVYYFEDFGGFYAEQNTELMEKIRAFEKERNCLVYAVTHENMEFGECYNFLYVPDYAEDFKYLCTQRGRAFFVFAYVWNKTDELNSESGSIVVCSFGGGIKRIG